MRKRALIKNESGFSMVELMIGLAVFSILLLGLMETHVLIKRYWVEGMKETSYQSAGRIALEKIAKAVRRSQGVTITDSSTETVATIRDFTGTTLAYIYNKDNQALEFDADVNTGNNDEEAILFHVMPLDTGNVFRIEGSKMLGIHFRVLDPEIADGTQSRDFTLQAHWRN